MTKVKKPVKSKQAKPAAKAVKKGAPDKSTAKTPAKVQKISVKGLKKEAKNEKEQKVKELVAVAKKAKKIMTVEVPGGPMDEKVSALSQKWFSLYKKAQSMDVAPYDMKKTFEPKTAIEHKTLGWGYILENRNDRLEVLFKDGIRFLISNYKG